MVYYIKHALVLLILVLCFINSDGALKNKTLQYTFSEECSVCYGVYCKLLICKEWKSCEELSIFGYH